MSRTIAITTPEIIVFSQPTKAHGYYSQFRAEVLDFIPNTAKRILDIGCGEGSVGGELKKRIKCEIWGVEKIPVVAEKARHVLDQVIIGDATEAISSLPDHYFDCVLLLDSLEHMIHPDLILQELAPKLSESHIIITSIPNIRYFPVLYRLAFKGEWDYTEHGVLDKTHLRFFTYRSIQKLFQQMGYEVSSMHGILPYRSWKFRMLNFVLLGALNEIRYRQFVCISRLRTRSIPA